MTHRLTSISAEGYGSGEIRCHCASKKKDPWHTCGRWHVAIRNNQQPVDFVSKYWWWWCNITWQLSKIPPDTPAGWQAGTLTLSTPTHHHHHPHPLESQKAHVPGTGVVVVVVHLFRWSHLPAVRAFSDILVRLLIHKLRWLKIF